MTLVIGPLDNDKLLCLDCGKFVNNTANYEMRQFGSISYSHSCEPNKKIRDRLKKELRY